MKNLRAPFWVWTVLPVALILTACGGASAMIFPPAPLPQRGQPFAQVSLPKPSAFALSAAQENPPASFAAEQTQPAPTEFSPAPQAEVFPSPAAEDASQALSPTFEPPLVSVYAAIVPDTPTPEYKPAASSSSSPFDAAANGEHWIDVDLSQQRVYAYAGDTLVNSFLVSTGAWPTPTVTGKFNIWVKLRSTTMSGPGYYLTNVPYVMYFYKGYGLHGTYWHNNFGTPMSHGCVNLSIPDAEWLYNFASVGTLVNVHY